MTKINIQFIQNLLSVKNEIAVEIAKFCVPKEYARGSFLCAPYTINNRGMFLVTGVVKYSYEATSGDETIFRISKGPSFIPYTLFGFFLSETSTTSCRAITDVRGYEIKSDKLLPLLERHLELYEFYFSIVLRSHQLIQSKEISIIQNTSSERYDQFVATFSDVINDIPLKDIANYLNIQPGSLSRIRKNQNT